MPSSGPVPVTLRLFAGAREAAGTARADVEATTVGGVLDEARRRFGPAFEAVLATSRVWVNGSPADPDDRVAAGDEVAVLPPVSGGAA
jgi:sulfur-carrier protein